MSGQKCGAVASETNDVPPKKCGVTVKTIQKWVVDSDREMDTSVWLRYEKVDRENVATLKCCVSAEFNKKLQGMRNYNPAFAVGSKNLQLSSYVQRSRCYRHAQASSASLQEAELH